MTAGTWLRTLVHLTPRQMLYQSLRRLRGPAQKPASTTREGLTHIATPLPPPSPRARPTPSACACSASPPYDPLPAAGPPTPTRSTSTPCTTTAGSAQVPLVAARATIEHWIDHHPRASAGSPTRPRCARSTGSAGSASTSPASTRPSRRRIFGSLAAQLEHLRQHVEHHLDGNHVWTNLAALASAGLALAGPAASSLAAALPHFATVVEAQLGPDGVHRERTPTYHCLLAEQLAGVVALDPARVHQAAARRLDAALARMLAALPAFTHPDGDVALWNDSQRGAPVTPKRLAARLSVPLAAGPADAPDAGLFRRVFGPWTLLWNAGGVGLPHQPGHIHADGLAFELSLHEERVVIDAGVGTYAPGFLRDYSRSTRAHNTVTVGEGDPDQHELWASHRVGGRARTDGLSFGPDHLEARIHGYRPAADPPPPPPLGRQAPGLEDRVEPDVPATVRIFFPESCALLLRDNVWHGRTAGGQRFRLRAPSGTPWACSPAHGWTGMNKNNPRRCLTAPLPPGGLALEFLANSG
jgi:hypothetical protein